MHKEKPRIPQLLLSITIFFSMLLFNILSPIKIFNVAPYKNE